MALLEATSCEDTAVFSKQGQAIGKCKGRKPKKTADDNKDKDVKVKPVATACRKRSMPAVESEPPAAANPSAGSGVPKKLRGRGKTGSKKMKEPLLKFMGHQELRIISFELSVIYSLHSQPLCFPGDSDRDCGS